MYAIIFFKDLPFFQLFPEDKVKVLFLIVLFFVKKPKHDYWIGMRRNLQIVNCFNKQLILKPWWR